jgi:hypothetical protein
VSDSEGNYRLINLPAGAGYQVTAVLEGFSRFERTGLVVRAGLNVALDISLQVGAVSETLTVEGDTPLLEVLKAEQNVNIRTASTSRRFSTSPPDSPRRSLRRPRFPPLLRAPRPRQPLGPGRPQSCGFTAVPKVRTCSASIRGPCS